MTETAPERDRPERVKPPKDVDESDSKGFAVYDTTIGQFVSEVTRKRPSKADAEELAGDHGYAIVRV
jgi:hypothetical protein